MCLRKADFTAKLLGISKQRVYQLARTKGAFPESIVIRLGKRQIRFNEDAILKWIAQGGNRKFKFQGEIKWKTKKSI